MKNVIAILVDSVYSECIGSGRTSVSSTPCIDRLAQDGFYAPNVYSYGPHTDVATKALYCGEPSLDNYGFYYSINVPDNNYYKVFHDNGYETYGLYYPYYLIGSKVERHIDHSIYTSGFYYESIWRGKLEYYAKIKKERDLSNTEYKLLSNCLKLIFDSYDIFYKNVQTNTLSTGLIRKSFINSNGYARLRQEYEQFRENNTAYIDSVLEQGMQHTLAGINEFDFEKLIDKDFIQKYVYNRHKALFRKIYLKNLYLNVRNNNIDKKKTILSMIKGIRTHHKEDLRYLVNQALLFSSVNHMKKRSKEKGWQINTSAGKQIDQVIEILKYRDSTKPCFISLHVEDPHHNVDFFSYDISDPDRIDDEIGNISCFIDEIGDSFRGSIMYQLSLRYVDNCIKRLMDYLEDAQIINDYTVMIVADHGSSYTGYPLRDTVTNNFHEENYHIPLVIWQKQMGEKIKGIWNGLYTSADVYPTLFDIVGIDKRFYEGDGILGNSRGRKVIVTEYTGPGCPDIINRDLWMSGRTKNYVVSYIIDRRIVFKKQTPYEIYDKRKDPLELKNIANRYKDLKRKTEIISIICAIENRYNQILKETNSFVKKLDDTGVIV